MSRIGNQPITVPSGVKVSLSKGVFTAEGPKGKVSQRIADDIEVSIDDSVVTIARSGDSRPVRALHGLFRSLLANAVQGVLEGFSKSLDIVGVGYRVETKGKELHLSLGYSHTVVFPIPDGIEVELEKNNRMIVRGADKQQVGQVAAELRALRPPDSYKGKGIRYSDEQIRLKVGKAGAGAGAGAGAAGA